MATPPDDELAGTEQPFVAHLVELRDRLLRSVWGVAIIFGALCAWPGPSRLYDYLARPLIASLPAGAHMIAVGVVSPFLIPIKVTVLVATGVALPWVLYQVWAFVAPGLYKHEKRLAMPLLVSAVSLFYGGCAFAYFVVLPMAFKFLVAVTPAGVSMMTDISHYLDFVGVMFIAFGASFELPVALVILVLLGWMTPAQLSKARPYAILGNSLVAALITPPDAVSMLMLAIPLCLLYEAGLLATRMLPRRAAAA